MFMKQLICSKQKINLFFNVVNEILCVMKNELELNIVLNFDKFKILTSFLQ